MATDPDRDNDSAGEHTMGSQHKAYAELGHPASAEAGAEREPLSARLAEKAERLDLKPLDPALGLETTNPSDPRNNQVDPTSDDARLNPSHIENADLDRFRNIAINDVEVPEEYAGLSYRELVSRQRELESSREHAEKAGQLGRLIDQIADEAQGPYEDFVVNRVGTATVVHGATFYDERGSGNTWMGDRVTVYGRDVLVGKYRDASKVVEALKAANYRVET